MMRHEKQNYEHMGSKLIWAMVLMVQIQKSELATDKVIHEMPESLL